jgi:hypothetical protein
MFQVAYVVPDLSKTPISFSAVRRCQTFPLVCKDFNRIHKVVPPRRKEFSFPIGPPITAPGVEWCLTIAQSLEKLELNPVDDCFSLLGDMLREMAARAPSLHRLILVGRRYAWCGTGRGSTLPVLCGVGHLTQLQSLEFSHWQFPQSGFDTQLQSLTGLHSLEVGPQCTVCCPNAEARFKQGSERKQEAKAAADVLPGDSRAIRPFRLSREVEEGKCEDACLVCFCC